jgi:hypothetical protein
MKITFFLVSFLFVLSCKSSKLEQEAVNYTLLSSKYASWVGGQPGVSGFNFEFAVKTNAIDSIEVTGITVNNQKVSFENLKVSGDTVFILGSYTNSRPKDAIGQVNSAPINSMGLPETGEIMLKLGSNLHKCKIDSFEKQPTSYYK